jgi:signal transduction histidine kinase
MWPTSILKRYVWSLLIISAIPPLFLAYYYFDALQNIHLEQRKQILIAISAKVEQQTRPLFDSMIDDREDLSPDQIMKFHDVLQPIIEKIQAEYPEYTVGISSPMLNGLIAMAPGFSLNKMGKGIAPLSQVPYNTGNFNFVIINNSLSQNGNTVMGVSYPVFYKGQVIAHAWSNIKTKQYFWDRIEQMAPSFLMVFSAWIGVLGLSWQLYIRFNKAIADVVEYLISGEESGKNILLFPEMNIVKDTMQDLRAKKRQSEEELARLDRLNLVGEMAAGIGHEVRNPMTTVRGYLQIFKKKQQFANYHEQVSTMIDELDRANCIITEFLSLAKNKAVEMRCGNLNRVITALFPLLQADAFRLGHEVQIELGDIPDSIFDEKEIRQLILNLVRNGLEAMEHSGVVTIRTYSDNHQVILAVTDIGVGIPAEVMDKIGTPFTTTKEQGTGLGLAVCYRVAHRHGAKIDVNTGSTGTTFTINFLPQTLEINVQ